MKYDSCGFCKRKLKEYSNFDKASDVPIQCNIVNSKIRFRKDQLKRGAGYHAICAEIIYLLFNDKEIKDSARKILESQ